MAGYGAANRDGGTEMYWAKRVAREILGLPQWPKSARIIPQNFEEQIYMAAVEAGDICYDVGAFQGDVSILLAKLATPTGRVIAFEPNIKMYGVLCHFIQEDIYAKAPVLTLPVGLSDKASTGVISIPHGKPGLGSMTCAPEWQEAVSATPSDIETVSCNFTTMDEIIDDGRYSTPDFIKIDVEGAELLVLKGGRKAFDRGHRPIMLIEMLAPWERAFRYGPWDALNWLRKYGYEFFFACPEGLMEHTPTPSEPFPAQYERGYNIVAYIPTRHAVRVSRLKNLLAGAGAILPMPPPPIPNKII